MKDIRFKVAHVVEDSLNLLVESKCNLVNKGSRDHLVTPPRAITVSRRWYPGDAFK